VRLDKTVKNGMQINVVLPAEPVVKVTVPEAEPVGMAPVKLKVANICTWLSVPSTKVALATLRPRG
jgi:hypothetical protein